VKYINEIKKLIKSNKKLFYISIISLLLSTVANLAIPYFIKELINNLDQQSLQDIPILLILFILLFQAITIYFRSFSFGILAKNITDELNQKTFKNIIKEDYNYFFNKESGSLVNNFTNDIYKIHDFFKSNLSIIIRYSIQSIGCILIMIYLSWKISSIILVIIPIYALIGTFFARKLKKLSKKLNNSKDEINSFLFEKISNIRTVFIFKQENKEIKNFDTLINKKSTLTEQRQVISSSFQSIFSFLINISLISILFITYKYADWHGLDKGELTAYILYSISLGISLTLLMYNLSDFFNIFSSIDRINNLNNNNQLMLSNKKIDQINLEIKNLSFAYNKDKMILNDINIKIEHGKIIGLVGESGSGKTTLINLILGLLSPTTGDIKINNQNENINELLLNIGYIPQDPTLFSDTIKNNICYGINDDQINIEKLISVCKKARIYETIKKLPEEFETLCGEKGKLLSGGQKQRIAIARAIIKNPSFLILDEATSAIDSIDENEINLMIQEIMKNKTTLIISHRLSAIKNADIIYVLKEGKIVSSGTHNELIKISNYYQKIFEKQKL